MQLSCWFLLVNLQNQKSAKKETLTILLRILWQMDEATIAAAKAAASSTLIVQSKRSRGGRRRGRKETLEEEKKEDEALALAQQFQLQAEQIKLQAQKDIELQAQKDIEAIASQEAEKRAEQLKIEVEKVKGKILGIFENENVRFNEIVRKTRVKFDKAAKFADRTLFTKELARLQKYDTETALLFTQLEAVSNRKPKNSKNEKAGSLAVEGKHKESKETGKGKEKDQRKGKEKAKKNSKKPSTPTESASRAPSRGGPRLDKSIRKVLQEMPAMLVKDCIKISKKRKKAYEVTGKHVRDVISACGEKSLIEEILDRKFKLHKIALHEKREARGEKNHSTSPVSKEELAGLAGGFPICTAARQGQHNLCKQLLELVGGDSVNVLDSNGVAPLLLVARAGYDLLTKILLDKGAFADAVDSGRCNALMLAARQENRFYDAERHRRTDLQKAFAKSNGGGGGKKQTGNDDDIQIGETPQNLNFRPLEKNHNRVLKLLISAGANINHRDLWGRSVLTHAAECGNHGGVRMLLRAGARVNSVDNDKQWTSIHYAVFNSHFFTVHNLIKGGANIDCIDNNGVSPLILAADTEGKHKLVELLLHSGANTGLTSTYGQSCASRARDRGDETLLELIRNGVSEKYDPNKIIIRVQTSKGYVKRRRKKKKRIKKKVLKEEEEEESKMTESLLNPSTIAVEDVVKQDDDESDVEDIRSDDDYQSDQEESHK